MKTQRQIRHDIRQKQRAQRNLVRSTWVEPPPAASAAPLPVVVGPYRPRLSFIPAENSLAGFEDRGALIFLLLYPLGWLADLLFDPIRREIYATTLAMAERKNALLRESAS